LSSALKNKFIPAITILIISVSVFSCKGEIKFDRAQCIVQDEIGQYQYRNQMLNDLMSTHKLKGLSFHELTELLGQPEKNMKGDSNEIYYSIVTDYGHDIDPIHTKNLAIKIGNNSTVTDFRVDEWMK
jgi:hypothetical protein